MSSGKLIVPSVAETVPEELAALSAMTAPERAWYASYPVFATNEDILVAAGRGELSAVTPNENFAPIGRLRNPELFGRFPPYLLPDSHLALLAIGGLWRSRLQAQAIDVPDLVLALTSLGRSDAMQQDLVNEGKLADPESTHRACAAFDIDASGYYEHDRETGYYIPVIHPGRSRAGMQKAAHVLQGAVTQPYDVPQATSDYDPRITDTLVTVSQELHKKGFINLIVEFVDQPSRCIHIAPNPEADWMALAA